jgi:hypothetical protein
MSSGVNGGSFYVTATKDGKSFRMMEGSTSVAWLACDGTSCRRYRVEPHAGSAAGLILAAKREGWACNDDCDFCDACVAKMQER